MADTFEAAVIAAEARGIASEAMALARSNELLTKNEFRHYDEKMDQIKEDIGKLDDKVDKGFRSFDQKFWTLAIALIGILLSVVGWFINYTVNHPPVG